MEIVLTTFLSSLKHAIHGTPLEHIPTLSSEQWNAFYQISAKQSVAPLIYQTIYKHPTFADCPEDLQQFWKGDTIKESSNQFRKTMSFSLLYQKMREEGLHPIVVKGIICRDLYPNPDNRTSNDEDLLILESEFSNMDFLLQEEGFQREELDADKKYQEISYVHPTSGVFLEVHLSLFAAESDAYGQLNHYFEDAFSSCEEFEINQFSYLSLNKQQHLFYLICHSFKHFLHSGFGLRQLCDILLFTQQYATDIAWRELILLLKKEHMYAFTMNLFALGIEHFEFSWNDFHLTKPTDVELDPNPLLFDMVDGGIFGKDSLERIHSSNITLQAVKDKSGSITSGIFASLFPDKTYIYRNYPYADKHKFLLPIAYIHRILVYIFHHTKTKEASQKTSTEIGKERIELLKKYKIIEK